MVRPKYMPTYIIVLFSVVAIIAIALAGVLSTHQAVNKLDHAAARNECARQVSADLDERFHHDEVQLFNHAFSGNRAAVNVDLRRMQAAPNVADEINRHCPASIAKGKP